MRGLPQVTVAAALAAALFEPRAGHAEGAPPELGRLVGQALLRGDEGAVAHIGDELGPAGIADCLEHGSRAARILCAEAGRYLERPWPVLSPLAGALLAHDRQVAAVAAESMVAVLSALDAGDLGPEEALPSEVEALLAALARAVESQEASPDVRALAVQAAGALSRLAGAAPAIPRSAVGDRDAAVRRAAVAALAGSAEAEDLAVLETVVRTASELDVAALAAASVCEATAGRGGPMPAASEARIRTLLADPRARPSQIAPVLACIARAPEPRVGELRALAARHPNEASRAAYQALSSPGER